VNKVPSADFLACLLVEKYPGNDTGNIKNVAYNCHRPTSHERLGGVQSGHRVNVFGNKVRAGAINSSKNKVAFIM